MKIGFVTALIAVATARVIPHFPNSSENVHQIKSKHNLTNGGPEEYWFNNVIDHYDNHGADSTTYRMRYLVDRQYFKPESGPILFYPGNEGDVWTFYDNAGFMTTTLAQEFGALVVFGEHRYFGESLPFGDASYDTQNLKYLTIEQATFDYVDLIKFIKDSENLQDRAVILAGGSYGGMLAAWMRIKFPQWFQGALASSAPILAFEGSYDPEEFYNIVTADYGKQTKACPILIKGGFDMLNVITNKPNIY